MMTATLPKTSTTSLNQRPATYEELKKLVRERSPFYISGGLTKKDLEAFYTTCHYLYQGGHYQKAYEFFSLLALLNNTDKRAWMGAGGCLEGLKNYQKALDGYAAAALLDGSDPEPYFRAFHCYLELGNTSQAIKALDQVIALSTEKESHYADFKKKAEEMKKLLSQKK